MWIMTMFDLPTDTAQARSAYTQFRNFLLDDGFSMMQYSVYARHCGSHDNALVHEQRIMLALPPDGEVRVVLFTDLQFSRIKTFFGKMRGATERAPEQLTFF